MEEVEVNRVPTVDRNHDGNTFLDVISDLNERQRTNEGELLSFYSFDDTKRLSVPSIDATPSTGMSSVPHEPPHHPRRMLQCGRTGEFYGYRDRIPSVINISSHPDEYWWSNANLQTPAITRDMGIEPVVLSRAVKVTVVPSSFFASHRDIEVFPEYLSLCRQHLTSGQARIIIFKIKMGEQVMVSLNEIINDEEFDRILLNSYSRDELLLSKMKFIISPINSPLPIPAKKPRDAETVGSYFGMDNVDFYIDESVEGLKVVSILVNIYSKWIIRKFLPLATSSLGRICDFILLSSDDKVVYADFRLLCTHSSRSLIKGNT